MIKRNFFFSEKIFLKESKFYVEGHHEAIVSREVFEKSTGIKNIEKFETSKGVNGIEQSYN